MFILVYGRAPANGCRKSDEEKTTGCEPYVGKMRY